MFIHLNKRFRLIVLENDCFYEASAERTARESQKICSEKTFQWKNVCLEIFLSFPHFPWSNNVQQSCASIKSGSRETFLSRELFVNEIFHGVEIEAKGKKSMFRLKFRRKRKFYMRKKSSTIYDEDYVKILLSSHYFSVS